MDITAHLYGNGEKLAHPINRQGFCSGELVPEQR